MTGQSLRAVSGMPAGEYIAWERHLAEVPPGDHLLQFLLAELIRTVEAFALGIGGGKQKPRSVFQIAPWLNSGAARREIDEMKKRESGQVQRSAVLDIVKQGEKEDGK